MLSVDGYTIGDRIHASRHSEVYTGTRDADGLRVILKLYRSSRGGPSRRAEHELQLLQRIDSHHVVRAVEVKRAGELPVLVLERVDGTLLSRHPMGATLPLADFLAIALAITQALTDVHEARVIHKDVKLSNLLLCPDQASVCLIDFGIATEFGRAERVAPPSAAEGTMRYIAPEQTGRLGLGIDFRTDLYSLGVNLYELLTGEPPFRGRDDQDLICAHIAQRPRPAADVLPSIPIAVSRIVDKLLEKDPERRYQTARGLAADLELCAKQLEVAGEIDEDLQLGSADVSDRLRFPSKLYGRERETAALRESLERITRGATEWVFLAGPAGIGKSSLAHALREPLVHAGGYLTAVKFDADRRDRPYAGISALIEDLVSQILASSIDRVEEWSARIRSGVGAIGSVLVELAPSLQYLVDDFPPVPVVGAREERERLSLAFCRLVHAVARREHPLTIFLDDLQWADAGSLALLTALARVGDGEALLVVGGYRDREVDAGHPAAELVAEVERSARTQILALKPLALTDTAALLADVLGRSPAETEGLARRVGPKSQHNPLLVRRLMFHLWDRDLVRYEHGRGWVWDEERLTEAEITDDAAALVAARVDALSDRARQLLKSASLMGTQFELELLVSLSGVDRLDVLHELMGLVDQGLIAPCRDGFKFVHDRIREAAQSRLESGERAALHHRAAKLIIARTPHAALGSVTFQLADHLIAAVERIDETERRCALEVLYAAGAKGLAKGEPHSAAHYLGCAAEILRETDWAERFDAVFGIQLQRAEAALQLRQLERANEILSALQERPLSPLQRAYTIAKQVALSAVKMDGHAVDVALDGLRSFGVHWPRRPSALRTRIEMWRTGRMLRGPIDDRMFSGSGPRDPSVLGPAVIIRAAAAQLLLQSNGLACLATGFGLRTLKRYGPLETPSIVLASYANLCITVQHDVARALHFARASTYWAERNSSPVADARSRITIATLVQSWVQPRRRLAVAFEALADASRELGDVEYSYLARHCATAYFALCGASLSQVDTLLGKLAALDDQPAARMMLRAYGLLRNDRVDWPSERSWIEEQLDTSDYQRMYGFDHILCALCIAGQFELAAHVSAALAPRLQETGGLGSRRADYAFFSGVASAALHAQTRARSSRRLHARVLRTRRRELRRWAQHGGDFAHMVQLLDAEALRLRKRLRPALVLYEQAAKTAQASGYVHHAALCHERQARLLLDCGRTMQAVGILATASALYEEWGARSKVVELEQLRRALGC